jgi:hypothetical protein
MTLRHTVRPPSQPSGPGHLHQQHPLHHTLPSTPSVVLSLTSSSASTRPSTAYPIVTPQFDQTSLYDTSVSDFTTPGAQQGGYDRCSLSQPRSSSSTSGDTIPTSIDFGTFGGGGEVEAGDASVVSSVWSSLEFDDLSEL